MTSTNKLESWVIARREPDEQEAMREALLAYLEYHRTGEATNPHLIEFGKKTYDYILMRDVLWWGRHYLPHHIHATPAEFHKELSEMLWFRNMLAVAAPRGHSKSTLVTVAHTLHEAAYGRAKFIIIIGNTQPTAIDHLDAIIGELLENEQLVTDYPHLAPPDPMELRKERKKKKRMRQSDFVTMGGVRFVARGAGQAIRGMKEGHVRPDLIVLDDVDDDQTVRSAKMRKHLYHWFDNVVMGLEGVETMRVRAVGTIIHKKALIAGLINRWSGRIWRAVTDFETQQVQWPAVWSFERLMAKRDGGVEEDGTKIKGVGRTTFAREYQNEPMDDKDAQVKEEWIQYGSIPAGFPNAGRISVGVDLAISEKEESSYNALTIKYHDSRSDKVYVLHAERWRSPIDDTRQRIIDAALGKPQELPKGFVLPPADIVAVEAVQFQMAVVQDIIPKVPCQVLAVTPDRDKRARFQVLANQYSIKRIIFAPYVPEWYREDILDPEMSDPKDSSVYAYLAFFAEGDDTKVSTAVLIQDERLETWA